MEIQANLSKKKTTRYEWLADVRAYLRKAKRDRVTFNAAAKEVQRLSGHPVDACHRLLKKEGFRRQSGYQAWNMEDRAKLRELAEKVSAVCEIARRMHRSPESVRSALKRFGVKLREQRDYYTLSELEEGLSVTSSRLKEWQEKGLKLREQRRGDRTVTLVRSEDLVAFLSANLNMVLFCNGKPPQRRWKFVELVLAGVMMPDDREAQTHHREELAIQRSAVAANDEEEEEPLDECACPEKASA